MMVMKYIFIERLPEDAAIVEMRKHGSWKDAVIPTDHKRTPPWKPLPMTLKKQPVWL
jgi:hypothetical protein